MKPLPRPLIRRALGLSVLLALSLLTAGCISGLFARSAGGKLVWWCDRCQTEVASMETHVCGLTRYDPASGRDVPMEGVTQEEVDKALAEMRERTPVGEPVRPLPHNEESKRGRWKFWQR